MCHQEALELVMMPGTRASNRLTRMESLNSAMAYKILVI